MPCALGTVTHDLAELGAGPAHVQGGVLHLSGVPLVVGRLRDVRVPRLHPSLPRRPGTATPLDADTVARLVGAGDGLTPRGDDVLCGWLALHRAAGIPTPVVDEAIRERVEHTTLLSATLLDCAMHGEVLPQFAAYVAALGTAAQAERRAGPARRRALDRLRAARGRPLGRRGDRSITGGGGVSSDRFAHVELRPGAYADSVTLLQVSRTVQGIAGVSNAQVAMATTLNLEVLTQMGFAVPAEATSNDMVVAVRLEDPEALDRVLAGVDSALHEVSHRSAGPSELAPPRTTATALRGVTDAIVLVSVPGAHAMVEAMDALDADCDVMVFSDNVPLAQEVELKRVASERGLLVMGPDCGTAVVEGVGLGFANIVQPGPVGIVAASGTGCQQLLALLDHAGVGVTSALGVGGRDLSAEVGGVSTLAALDRLDADPAVELVVMVSKPPAEAVAEKVRSRAAELSTPVELALLGPGRPDLTAAVESVLVRLGREVPTWPVIAPAEPLTTSGGRWLRGLFVGGTLCDEAMLIASDRLGPVHSNIPLDPSWALDPHQPSPAQHTMLDFGDDALTAGRAHPMIDPALRLEHLAQVAADEDTAVILLDVVLGHGAEPDPATALAAAIGSIRKPVVVAVVGTGADPQDLARQVQVLADAGAEVHLSNAGATRRALDLLGEPS